MSKPKTKKGVALEPISTPSTVDWPLGLVNFLPSPYQQISTVIPGQIYTLPKFFPPKLCDELIRWFESSSNLNSGSTPINPGSKPAGFKSKGSSKGINANGTATTNTGGNSLVFSTTQLPPKQDYAARVNDRAQVYDKLMAKKLWQKLKVVLLHNTHILNKIEESLYSGKSKCDINFDEGYEVEEEDDVDNEEVQEEFEDCIGLNDHFRIYRYIPGHYFGQHYDDSVKASVIPTTENTNKTVSGETLWTLLIYLTGEQEGEVSGGETVFYPNEADALPNPGTKGKKDSSAVKVSLQKGTLLLHKHGDDCFLHEGALVKSGVKWVFRTDLVYPLE